MEERGVSANTNHTPGGIHKPEGLGCKKKDTPTKNRVKGCGVYVYACVYIVGVFVVCVVCVCHPQHTSTLIASSDIVSYTSCSRVVESGASIRRTYDVKSDGMRGGFGYLLTPSGRGKHDTHFSGNESRRHANPSRILTTLLARATGGGCGPDARGNFRGIHRKVTG